MEIFRNIGNLKHELEKLPRNLDVSKRTNKTDNDALGRSLFFSTKKVLKR